MSPQQTHNGIKPVVKISVTDSGLGIKAGDLERIFNPFEQIENENNARFRGTGLGLSLCHNFVKLHGGRIWAESSGEGQGASFQFTLPVSNMAENPDPNI